MNRIFKTNGLSARRRTISNVEAIGSRAALVVSRATRWGFVIGLAALLWSCNEKSDGQDIRNDADDKTAEATDSLPEPKVDIKVNRHYDDEGNLIGFDSVYTSYYSTVAGDTVRMDSLMRGFDSFFNSNFRPYFDNQFNTLFFDDSLRHHDFFHEDFFLKRYEMNDEYFRDMMQRMDSIKNRFYQGQSRREERPGSI